MLTSKRGAVKRVPEINCWHFQMGFNIFRKDFCTYFKIFKVTRYQLCYFCGTRQWKWEPNLAFVTKVSTWFAASVQCLKEQAWTAETRNSQCLLSMQITCKSCTLSPKTFVKVNNDMKKKSQDWFWKQIAMQKNI